MSIADIASKALVAAEYAPKVYEAGRKDEYDRFWDIFQDFGNRRNYSSEFRGFGFNIHNFYPKYDIAPSNISEWFKDWNGNDDLYKFSLKDRMAECGVRFDFSNLVNFSRLFYYNSFTELPELDCSNATELSQSFAYNYRLITIEKLIVSENTVFTNTFISSGGLENITIGGTIGQNGFNVSPCTKLTHDSLMSIINALKENPTIASPVVTLGTANLAKLDDDEKAIATQKGWTLA